MVEICAFYHFLPLSEPEISELTDQLESMAKQGGIQGLVLIGSEGLNFTISGSSPEIRKVTTWLTDRLKVPCDFKISRADRHPFQAFRVKVKQEIVTMGRPDLVPSGPDGHITPAEWNARLRSGRAVVLDTRNRYEVEIGKFKGAVDFDIREFHEFPEQLKKSEIPKHQEVLIYCTGGIRCEKAMLEMKQQGYANVHQLQGGILNYLKEFPQGEFEGECFVFDYRVAVDAHLAPSRTYKLCVHCGQPAATELECPLCHKTGMVCTHCSKSGVVTCSKNCENHARLGSKSNRPHVQEHRKRHRL